MWSDHGKALRSRLVPALCCSAWLLAAGTSWASDAEQPEARIYESELTRLIEISTRLATLNETLKNELKGSKQSSEELALTLKTSRSEADELRKELASLKATSIELARSAELSATESAELREALTKADSSLTNLEASFESYRTAAEERISKLERKSKFLGNVVKWLGALALGGWGAWASTTW